MNIDDIKRQQEEFKLQILKAEAEAAQQKNEPAKEPSYLAQVFERFFYLGILFLGLHMLGVDISFLKFWE